MSATQLIASEEAKSDFSSALASVVPFAGLPAPAIKSICRIGEHRHYGAGETIFSPGQFDGGEFLFVWRGRVKAAFANPSTGAMHIEEFGVNAFFGLAEAVVGGEYPQAELLTLTAEEEADVVTLDAEAFRELFQRRPALTRALAQYFARALVMERSQLSPEDLSPERRVFAALLEFVERDAVTGAWRVARMPKHRELAEKADADEAAAASAIAHLIQEGVARRDYPGLIIDDISQLNALAR